MEFLSWNVAGLQDPEKLARLISLLQRLPYQVIFLQEVHLPNSSLPWLTQLWRGQVFLSPDPVSPTSKAGVMTLVKDHPDLSVLANTIHHPGQSLSIHIKWKDEELWLLNVYAPAEKNAQPAFYNSLPKPPPRLIDASLLAGDWNCVLSSKDRIGGRQ